MQCKYHNYSFIISIIKLISIHSFHDALGGLLSALSSRNLSRLGLFFIALLCYGIVILYNRSLGYH